MGPGVIVAVEDAGVGFGQDEAARLFEAFYTRKPGGLGMGLSISRSIIDSHGATFHFALPSDVKALDPASIPSASRECSGSSGTR